MGVVQLIHQHNFGDVLDDEAASSLGQYKAPKHHKHKEALATYDHQLARHFSYDPIDYSQSDHPNRLVILIR